MSRTKLVRWSGLPALLAGVLFVAAALVHPVGEDIAAVTDPNWVPAHLLGLAFAMFWLLGLVGLYARQADRTGWLGLIGFVLALAGTAFVVGIQFMVSSTLPVVAAQAPGIFGQARTPPPHALLLFALGFGLGNILFGIAILRARVLPRWSGLLLSLGMLVFMFAEIGREAGPLPVAVSFVIGPAGQVLMSIGLIWMGAALLLERRAPASECTLAGECAPVHA
ncbi:MAG: hypothetical protein ACK2VD_01070 [Anaerolineae bacterium]